MGYPHGIALRVAEATPPHTRPEARSPRGYPHGIALTGRAETAAVTGGRRPWGSTGIALPPAARAFTGQVSRPSYYHIVRLAVLWVRQP